MDYRAEIDADVTFLNGGGLQAQGFRLDVPGPDVSHEDLAALLVRSLGLLMTEEVRLSSVRFLCEPHKGTRGGPSDQVGVAVPTTHSGRLVELNHVITAGMTTYPGLPGPQITSHLSRQASRERYAPGTEFSLERISMVGNTGTYLDSPHHRYAHATDLAGLPLQRLVSLPAVVVRTAGSHTRGVDVGALAALHCSGHAVLLHTGGDHAWGTDDYGHNAPYLTEQGARWLVDHDAALVGIDAVNIDDITGQNRPAHSLLLAASIPIVEHLTGLEQLPPTGARFTAVPPRVKGFSTFPVRAFAVVPD